MVMLQETYVLVLCTTGFCNEIHESLCEFFLLPNIRKKYGLGSRAMVQYSIEICNEQ